MTSGLAWLVGRSLPLVELVLSSRFGLLAAGAYLLSGAIGTLVAGTLPDPGLRVHDTKRGGWNMKIAIVGAGMAGLACADGLSRTGHQIVLFDKGRGPGGRMATRRVPIGTAEVGFDHGAQYFTARDSRFAEQVARWQAEGVVALWPAAGPEAWVGMPGMSAVVGTMAARVCVRWQDRVEALERFSSGLNRGGFTRPRFSDSRSRLAKEAGMDGSSFIA